MTQYEHDITRIEKPDDYGLFLPIVILCVDLHVHVHAANELITINFC